MVPGKSKFFLVSINIHMDYIQIFSSGKVRFWFILSKLEVMNYFLQILTFYWCISSTPKFQFADGQYRSWDLKDGQFLQYGKVTSQNWVSKTHIIDVAKNINIKSRVGKVGGCCRRRRRMRAGNGVEMKYNCSLSYIISQITDIPTIISHIADIRGDLLRSVPFIMCGHPNIEFFSCINFDQKSSKNMPYDDSQAQWSSSQAFCSPVPWYVLP